MEFPILMLAASIALTAVITGLFVNDVVRCHHPRRPPRRPDIMQYEISYTDRLGRPAKALVKASSPERARLHFVSQNLGLEVTGVELLPNE